MRNNLRSVLLTILAFSLFVSPCASQERVGSIAGRVEDTTKAVLEGAAIQLKPTSRTAASDEQGAFTMYGVAPGHYTLWVTYVGFEPFSKEIDVTPGASVKVDAVLKIAAASQEITVRPERERGEEEAINRQRTADNIVQVLPVEVITSLPNTNIADALGRLPSVTLERDEGEGKYVQIRGLEPRLSNVTIDGVNVPSPEGGVRQIKLDVIPANLVDSVEINKTLSANQDGDAIGGSVNLVTKTAEEEPSLYLNGYGGYTPIIGGRSVSEIDGYTGKRFGANHKLGVLFGASYDWNGRGIDDVEPVPTAVQDASGNFVPTYSTEDLREYRYYRTRYGFTGSIDYKLGDVSGLYARMLYSHFDNFGDRWVYTPTINTFVTPTVGGPDGNMTFNSQIRRPVEVIGSLDAGGKHAWTRWLLAYEIAASRSSSEDHGYDSADFNGPQGTTANPLVFSVDTSNPVRPKLVPQAGFGSIYNPATYSFADIDLGQSYSPQVNLQASFSAARNYNWAGHFGTLEFGGKFRSAHKFEDSKDPVYDSVNGPLMTQFLDTFTNSGYYDKSYTLGPATDFSKIKSYLLAHINDPNFFTLDANSTALNSFPNNYDLIERVSAGYLMNTLEFGRVRVQTGVRFEGTNENVTGFNVAFDNNGNFTGTVNPIQKNSDYLDVLPSVQLRFGLPHDADVRLVYGRGISRPNFADLPPTFNARGNKNEVDIGNPNLRPTHANNYDVLFEQYLKPLGVFQAGFFYKQLGQPIYESVKTAITSQFAQQNPEFGQFVGFDLSQAINGKSADLYGFEIAYQQHLTFLPGLLRGLGFSGNYGYTHSFTNGVPLRTDAPALLRQAPNTWNISPTYDMSRYSVRVGISHNDANIFSYNFQNLNSDGTPAAVPLGIKGPNGDTYLYAHTQVDAQGSVRMYKGLEFVAFGLNLTNEVFGFYNGSPQFPIQREYYKPTYAFGLRYNLQHGER